LIVAVGPIIKTLLCAPRETGHHAAHCKWIEKCQNAINRSRHLVPITGHVRLGEAEACHANRHRRRVHHGTPCFRDEDCHQAVVNTSEIREWKIEKICTRCSSRQVCEAHTSHESSHLTFEDFCVQVLNSGKTDVLSLTDPRSTLSRGKCRAEKQRQLNICVSTNTSNARDCVEGPIP